MLGETYQYSAARRSKSRNKVAVGEPAAGSLPKSVLPPWQSDRQRAKGAPRDWPLFHAAAGRGLLRQHLPVDVLAPGSMKTVAKHDNQWKLQKQETHQVVERNCERVLALLMGC